MRTYQNAGAVSFPLGGIGTGSVGLSGDGRLIDWELFGRPNRMTINGFTHFAIRAEGDGIPADCRVLQGDTTGDFMGGLHRGNHSWGYGHGPNRATMAGFRHFRQTAMEGFYPVGQVTYEDEIFPGEVKLKAFNPFIPLNDKDSSIPAAFFTFEVKNPTDRPMRYLLAFSCGNPMEEQLVNRGFRQGSRTGVQMTSAAFDTDSPKYGEAVIATDCPDAFYQESWYRGGWFDEVTTFWREFSSGQLRQRSYPDPRPNGAEICTLAVPVTAEPGETRQIRLLLSWYMPNMEKYWDEKKPVWKHYYASLFSSARQAADYCLDNWTRLEEETLRFRDALASSTLPEPMLDAVQGNLAILKSSTCLRLPDGSFYGWEGVGRYGGSCEGSCTHVWNYAYALPFLFPALERSMRELDYTYNYSGAGKMSFRLQLPVGSPPDPFRACVDGQMGGIMKMYREWKLSGDDDFLRRHWERVWNSLAYAWSSDNPDRWDPEQTGVLTGRQHHTLDMELFGPSSWLEGFYLGALKAAAEMAEHLGQQDKADLCRALFRKGSAWTEEHLFTGKQYIQKIDLNDPEILRTFAPEKPLEQNPYWNSEDGEIKYQIGEGCEIDQVLAAWHGDLMGLGQIFDPAHRRAALQRIYELNFKSMREMDNPCRIFCLDDEKGVIMCQWAEDARKPGIPVPYTEETMCGFEYAVACNMLQCGMEKEAVEIAAAIRDRYDGVKRNPWAEIECGASYARSMASYSFLLVCSGFRYDLTRGMIGFCPLHPGQYFWSAEGAWGTARWTGSALTIRVLYGGIDLQAVATSLRKVEAVTRNGSPVPFAQQQDEVHLSVRLETGDELTLSESVC